MAQERIERKGRLFFSGYSSYIQEIKKSKKTESKNIVAQDLAVELKVLPDECGQKVNLWI